MIHLPVPMLAEVPSPRDEKGAVASTLALVLAFLLAFALAVWDEYGRNKRDKVLPREFLPPTRPEGKHDRRD